MRRGVGRRPRNGGDDEADIERADRRERVFALRVERKSLREISRIVGISHEQVREDIARVIAERGNEGKEESFALINGALEAVLEGHTEKARRGDAASAAAVTRAARELAELRGCKAPAKVEHSGALDVSGAKNDVLSKLARAAAALAEGADHRKPDGGRS